MKFTESNKRTLAFKKARELNLEDLDKIGGGSSAGTTVFTTKQTFDTRGNWDAGGDVQWD